jgi:hypothetical protein
MRRTFPIIFAISFVAVLFGCNGGSGPITPGLTLTEGPDLDDEFGGYGFTNELPAFGEPGLFGQDVLAEDTPYEDELENDPDVNEMAKRPNARAYMLRITWGQLVRTPDEEAGRCRDISIDWTGRLRLDRGAVILKRLIQFDPEDYVHERTDRRVLEWTSFTGPHFDGILVKIIDAPPASPDSSGSEAAEANRLVFRTGPYSHTFTTDELEHLDLMVPVDRCGNAISFTGFRVDHEPCPHGFLAGIWKSVSPDTIPPDSSYATATGTVDGEREIRGHFYGNWIQSNGMLAGHLKGVYGLDSSGRQVFFGKYIDLAGNFKGILRGTYGSMSMGPFMDTAGWFNGEWIDENKIAKGRLRGLWVAPQGSPKGFFHGEWGGHCQRGPDGGA